MRETLNTVAHDLIEGERLKIDDEIAPLLTELINKGFPVKQDGDLVRVPAHLQRLAWRKLQEISG